MAATPEALYERMLVIRSQMGDDAAFQELLQMYGPRLLRFTERMMQSAPEQVADVVQETWIAIYRALPRLLEVSKFRPWAFRIARDLIYREYRRRKLHLQPMDEAQLAEVPATEEPCSAADREELLRCLDAISPEHREALVLRFFDEMSYEEIAGVTGSSVGTVRSRIHYGRQALKKAWKGKTT
ncbi:MAG TPA: sigma-70 family RNA polymerase sigma factor [Verrucomicrobiae bacterium]|jgi:RNA polymerase sigma-70 factor (ECF subfamily)